MTTTKTTHDIDKFKKLVDLNGDSVNFDISFKVTTQNNEPFDILVVDQTTLDNNKNLEYKRANGFISGNLLHDKNVYQNYYLILKADQPCQCVVEITKKDLPRNTNPLGMRPQIISAPPKTEQKSNLMKIFFFALIISGGAYALYIFYKKSKTQKEDTGNMRFYTPPNASPINPSPARSLVPKHNFSPSPPKNPLATRLQNLKV